MVGQQLTRSAVTDETGFFNLLAMPRGSYEITAQLTGFATQQTKAELTAGENLRVDFKMNLGQLSETVVVAGTAALVETRSATMSGLVDDRRVQELPLNGRNVVELASTLPGITDVTASEEMASTRGGPTMIVHGASRGQNNFTLNGANFTNYSQTAGFNPPPPDAVQEIRVQTSTFSAEFGNNAGAQVTMVTKAGSNQFHGSVWEFHRNDALNARNYFAPRKSDQKQNQWGASAGGRIVPNKLFFFGSYQKLTNRAEAVGQVADRADRRPASRRFHRTLDAVAKPDRWSDRPAAAGTRPGTLCVTAGSNVINPSCISPVAKNYLDQFIPRSATGTVVKLIPSPLDAYNFVTRVDYTVSSKNTMYGHFFKDNYERISSPGNLDYVPESNVADIKNYGITDTHTFSSTFLNELTVSYLDTESFRTATERVPPRDMGINIDEGYLGVGMSLNVSGGPNLCVHRARAADLQKLALEGRHDARQERPHVQVGLRRAVRQLRPDSRKRRAQRHVHGHTLRKSDGRLHARRVRQREPRLRRRRQLPAALEASVLHPGRMEADAAHHDERRVALRAVVPVGAGVRPLYVVGVRHAVDRQARCAARHSVPGRSECAVQDGRERLQQLRAAIRRGVGRQRQRQNRRARRLRDLLQPHQRNVGARGRGAVDRHGAIVQRTHRRSVRFAQPRGAAVRRSRSRASSDACRSARIQG